MFIKSLVTRGLVHFLHKTTKFRTDLKDEEEDEEDDEDDDFLAVS